MTNERRRILLPGDGGEAQSHSEVAGPQEDSEPGDCECPVLDREDWDGVESDWSDITFLRTTLTAVAGVPVGFDTARSKLMAQAEALGATVSEGAMLLIGEGRFRRPLLLEVDGAPPDHRDVYRPGGVAFTRIAEAPWSELTRATKRVREEATKRYGRPPADMYAWYLTCRTCSGERSYETLLVAHYRP
jgi:hypothetical protein